MGLRGPGAKAPKRKTTKAKRSRRKLQRWLVPGLSRPERVIAFLASLEITSGPMAGQPFTVTPEQRRFIFAVYGPARADGRRIVREAVLSMGRKGGKTGFLAGLTLCHLVGPEAERRGQVIAAASDRNQSGIIYDEALAFLDARPDLRAQVVVRAWNKSIEDTVTGSVFKAISADAKRQHGLSPSFAVLDEVAQWPGRDLYDAIRTAGGGRANPLLVTISTQSADPHSIMSELVDYARQLNEGTHEDPTFVGFVYSAPDDCELDDEDAWLAANPGLPYGLPNIDELRTAAAQAKRIPARESSFRLLHLNQPVDADDRFIHAADWLACGDEVDVDLLRGARCFGGLDLSSTQDLTAFALYFPDFGGASLLRFWLPEHELEQRELRDRVPYRVWADQGLLELTPGRAIDRAHVARRVAELISPFDCQVVAFDRWRIEDFKKTVDDEGLDIPLRGFGQGFASMSPAVEELERAVLDRRIKHGGNPVLTWNAASAVVDSDAAGNRKLNKARANGRIDGLVALVMAIGVSITTETESGPLIAAV
jgi:phage terminase large subunit-like protein